MALRPNNHITGDSAVRRISSDLIPEEWTISIPDSDYGLDMLVEVVVDNKTTGQLFFVQSKGTTDTYHDGTISYSMSVERIQDYSKILLPVLFVLYSKTENRFWGRWMNSLYNQLDNRQKEQKTFSLAFAQENEIDVNYLREIGLKIKPVITNQVSLHFLPRPIGFKRFDTQLIRLINQYVSGDVTLDGHLCIKTLEIAIRGTADKGDLTIGNHNESVTLPISFPRIDFLYYPNLTIQDVPQCVLYVLFVVAFYSSGLSRESRQYVLSHLEEPVYNLIPADEWISFVQSVPDEDFRGITPVLDFAVKADRYELVQYIIFRAFCLASSGDEFNNFYRGILGKLLSENSDDETNACLCYNIANGLREFDLREAFSWYYRAAKYNPDYLNRAYWWVETAGILYMTSHFNLAESFYENAKTIGGDDCREDIDMLISDCLVCQGRLEEASKYEAYYLETSPSDCTLIVMRSSVTNRMIDNNVKCFDSRYWFNEGIRLSQEDNHAEALNCFLFSWRLYDSDIESLSNAFIEALNIGDFNTLSIIICALRAISPDIGYRYILNTVFSENNGMNGDNEALIDAIESVLLTPLDGGGAKPPLAP